MISKGFGAVGVALRVLFVLLKRLAACLLREVAEAGPGSAWKGGTKAEVLCFLEAGVGVF